MRPHGLGKKRRLGDECAGLGQALTRRAHRAASDQREYIFGCSQGEQGRRRSVRRKENHAALLALRLAPHARRDFSLGDLL